MLQNVKLKHRMTSQKSLVAILQTYLKDLFFKDG